MARRLLTAAILWTLWVAAGSSLLPTGADFSQTTQSPGNTFQAAASFCSAPGNQTVAATADTWVDENQSNRNHGTSTTLEVNSAPGRAGRTLVRFPLPGIPTNCSVTAATLRLYASLTQGPRTLHAYRAASAWSENAVTWNTQPPTAGPPASTDSGAGWRLWDVTSQVQAMYSGSNHGFLVRDSVEGDANRRQRFDSVESAANVPELVVTFG